MQDMKVQEFVYRLKEYLLDKDKKITFFLGAGCSVSSGIPTASQLVKYWLPKLKKYKKIKDEDWEAWLKTKFPEYDENNLAKIYADIMKSVFIHPAGRQHEIERLCDKGKPGFGYSVFAQLLTIGKYYQQCNIVLTTNFDDLIADAMYYYTQKKPLVITHESLIGYITITRPRPQIIKLHGDARIAPKNTEDEIKRLDQKVSEILKNILSETGLIFIGYGGNDKSIVELLKKLPNDALPYGVYWINNHIPDSEMGDWLEKRESIWIKHSDFDELMLELFNELELDHPPKDRFKTWEDTYRKTYETLSEKIDKKADSEDKKRLKKAVDEVAKKFESWYSVYLEAKKYQKDNPEKADKIFQEGLTEYPNSSALLGIYADFLCDFLKDYDKAEEYCKKSIDTDPKNLAAFGRYAIFLKNISKNYKKAEDYYTKALADRPDDCDFNGNYSGFLLSQGRYKEGFEYLNKAYDLADNNTLLLECWFYTYAHKQDENQRDQSLSEIKKLIKSGERSFYWNLDDNVKRAITDSHPEPEFLKTLAKVISDELDAKELDKFAVWKKSK